MLYEPRGGHGGGAGVRGCGGRHFHHRRDGALSADRCVRSAELLGHARRSGGRVPGRHRGRPRSPSGDGDHRGLRAGLVGRRRGPRAFRRRFRAVRPGAGVGALSWIAGRSTTLPSGRWDRWARRHLAALLRGVVRGRVVDHAVPCPIPIWPRSSWFYPSFDPQPLYEQAAQGSGPHDRGEHVGFVLRLQRCSPRLRCSRRSAARAFRAPCGHRTRTSPKTLRAISSRRTASWPEPVTERLRCRQPTGTVAKIPIE